MSTVALGRTGMCVSRVGLGTWAMGGPNPRMSWGPQDDRVSVRTIRHAVERGVNWLDTAPIYGLGHAEEVVGGTAGRSSLLTRAHVGCLQSAPHPGHRHPYGTIRETPTVGTIRRQRTGTRLCRGGVITI
jgi:hypothetical protein